MLSEKYCTAAAGFKAMPMENRPDGIKGIVDFAA